MLFFGGFGSAGLVLLRNRHVIGCRSFIVSGSCRSGLRQRRQRRLQGGCDAGRERDQSLPAGSRMGDSLDRGRVAGSGNLFAGTDRHFQQRHHRSSSPDVRHFPAGGADRCDHLGPLGDLDRPAGFYDSCYHRRALRGCGRRVWLARRSVDVA